MKKQVGLRLYWREYPTVDSFLFRVWCGCSHTHIAAEHDRNTARIEVVGMPAKSTICMFTDLKPLKNNVGR